MTTYHAAWEFVAGDDWEIRATLLDENDAPYDLSGNPTLKWTMMDNRYRRVIDEGDYSISITDALAGKCTILIPSATTTQFDGGFYTDALRIISGGITSTLFYGPIYLMGDPWMEVTVANIAYGDVRYFRPKEKVSYVSVTGRAA